MPQNHVEGCSILNSAVNNFPGGTQSAFVIGCFGGIPDCGNGLRSFAPLDSRGGCPHVVCGERHFA